MTSAPRSAMWRVQIGAATACSSATTRMPSRGRTIFWSPVPKRGGKRRDACVSKLDHRDGGYPASDSGSRCEYRSTGNGAVRPKEIADCGASLCKDRQSGGHVPEVDVQLDVGIDTTGGIIGEAESAGPAE